MTESNNGGPNGLVTYGPKIKQLRALRRWTQLDLAKITGVSQVTVSAIETGKQRPSAKTLRAMDVAFGGPIERLEA